MTSSSQHDPKDIVQQHFTAINERDKATVRELHAEDDERGVFIGCACYEPHLVTELFGYVGVAVASPKIPISR